MASAQVVETSVTNNSPSQDSYHPGDLFQSRYATPGFKPFSYLKFIIIIMVIMIMIMIMIIIIIISIVIIFTYFLVECRLFELHQ